MAPEIRTFIPNEGVDEFRRAVNRIPGARIIAEELDVDEFSQRITEVIGNLNPDEVRVIDLDFAKSSWAKRRRNLSGLNPQTPPRWEEFTNSLDLRERSELGQVLRPLIRHGFGGLPITELKDKTLSTKTYRSSRSRLLAEKIFGIKFDSDQEVN